MGPISLGVTGLCPQWVHHANCSLSPPSLPWSLGQHHMLAPSRRRRDCHSALSKSVQQFLQQTRYCLCCFRGCMSVRKGRLLREGSRHPEHPFTLLSESGNSCPVTHRAGFRSRMKSFLLSHPPQIKCRGEQASGRGWAGRVHCAPEADKGEPRASCHRS